MEDDQVDRKLKVVLVGDGGVGKTSLVKRFVHETYSEKYIKALGVNVYTKDIVFKTKTGTLTTGLQIYDVMG